MKWIQAAAALLAVSCLGSAAPAAESPDAITIATQLEPTQLDLTAGTAAATEAALFPAVYEGLVHISSTGTVEPLLAASWEISPDGLVYTFHLRRGVRFHDGTPFDASVVKFALERAAAPGSPNMNQLQLAKIRAVEVIDPQTAAVHLNSPYSNLLQVLGWYATAMVAPASAANNGRSPVGTGPFRFANWRHGEALELVANLDYGGSQPSLARVTYRFIGDPNAALAALRAGDIDAYDAYPAPENIGQLKADPRFNVFLSSGSYKAILALNNARPPFNDVRVRRALSYAVDRRAIIEAAMFGYAKPIGSHYAPSDPDYLDLTDRYPFDPTRARQLLAEAGYASGLDLTLKLPPLSYARRSGEIIASQLAQIGVRVKLANLEWSTWLAEVFGQHDYDMTVVMHVEPLDYDIYGRDDCYFGYSSPEFKALLRRLDATVDGPGRQAAIRAVQQQISDDAVNVFLFTPIIPSVSSVRIQNLWERTASQIVNLGATRIVGANSAARSTLAPSTDYRVIIWLLLLLLAAISALAFVRAGPVFLLSRLLALLAVALVASLAIFVIVQWVPGDPARYIRGDSNGKTDVSWEDSQCIRIYQSTPASTQRSNDVPAAGCSSQQLLRLATRTRIEQSSR
jgi:peptide/nickel transport system substrate-binding protein